MNQNQFLLDGFAFLALDVFARIAHALALVRLRRVEAANLGGDLADDFFVRAFDGQLGVFLDGHLDLGGNRVINGMRKTERQVHHVALNGGFEADALNFELFDKAIGHALDHVVDVVAGDDEAMVYEN